MWLHPFMRPCPKTCAQLWLPIFRRVELKWSTNKDRRAYPGGLCTEVGLEEQGRLGSCPHTCSGGTEGGMDSSMLTVSQTATGPPSAVLPLAGREMPATPLLMPCLISPCVIRGAVWLQSPFPTPKGKLAPLLQDWHGVASVESVAQYLSA